MIVYFYFFFLVSMKENYLRNEIDIIFKYLKDQSNYKFLCNITSQEWLYFLKNAESSKLFTIPKNIKLNCSKYQKYPVYHKHALERIKERNIKLNKKLTVKELLNLPTAPSENGCIKYLYMRPRKEKNEEYVVYYVRQILGFYVITTLIKNEITNPIPMLRYYAEGKKLDFEKLCRDHMFNTCKRKYCKYIHIDY